MFQQASDRLLRGQSQKTEQAVHLLCNRVNEQTKVEKKKRKEEQKEESKEPSQQL